MGNAMYILTSLILIVYTVIGQFKFIYAMNERVNKSAHEYNIENATDYAMFAMLAESEDLQADYANFGAIDVNPSTAYDNFIRQYAFSEFNSNSDQAIAKTVKRYICGLCLTYDGYYIIDSDSRITAKIPYIYEYSSMNDDVGAVRYNINLSESTIREIDYNTGSRKSRKIEPGEYDAIVKQLESTISKEINIKIQNFYNNGELYNVYTPFFKNAINGVQGVNSISLIFLMDNDFTYIDKPEISVSASRVVVNRFVLGYERNGEKVYTWASNRKKVEEEGFTIKKLFKDKKTAAKNGYNFDVIMQYK